MGSFIFLQYYTDHYQTGLRIKRATSQIEDFFLLLCDNFCELNLGEMWNSFKEKKQANNDYSLQKILKIKLKIILIWMLMRSLTSYDKKRKTKKKFLDIGFMFLSKEIILDLSIKNISFLRIFLFKNFLKKKKYRLLLHTKSILVLEVYQIKKETNEFFKRKKLFF